MADGLGPIVGETPYRTPFYGGQVAQERGLETLPASLLNPQMAQDAPGPNYFQGGMLTYEKPVIEFPAEVNVAVSSSVAYKAGDSSGALPNTCVGITFTNVIGAPAYSINGGGARTMINNSGYAGVIIRSLQIITGPGDSCTFSAVGTGA